MGRLGIELSALSAQELRRLLEVARARGQTALAQQLTAELDGRTAAWRAPPITAPRSPITPDRATSPVSPAARSPLAAALVGLATAALAWGLTVPLATDREGRQQAEAPPPVRLAVALTPGAMTHHPGDADAPADQALAAPAEPDAVAPRPAHNPCLDKPTAAERLVCGFPALAERDRRMVEAYTSARARGVDIQSLDDAQAIWRARSADVTDRHELADLYEARIRELQALAARSDSAS